ncbi:MAG: hypothetical protein JSV37_11590 [Anaerolineaceae bacterium]|nr:MAG: hypothetical protein JSV37_11590 [Anaerolineaceae bacterium]
MHNCEGRPSLIVIVLSLLLTVLMLSGCGERGETPATSDISMEVTEVAIQPKDTPLPVSSLTSISPLLPDLVVELISIEWEMFEDCIDVPRTAIYRVDIRIANVGELDAGSFRVGISGYLEEIILKRLRPGENITLEFEWIDLDLDVGETLWVFVDEDDRVLESDEGNNVLSREVSASAAIPSCPPTPEPTPCPGSVPIPLLPPDQPVSITSLHMINSTVGWAVAGLESDDAHILRTDDGGRSWLDVTPPQMTMNCGQYPLHARGYYHNAEVAWLLYYEAMHARSPSGIWRTLDGGKTWELSLLLQRNTDTFGGLFTWPILEFIDSEHGWLLIDYFLGAGSHGAELFRTIDGGRSWELIPEAHLTRGSGLDMIDRMHGWETSNHPIVVYMGLAVTDDGGHTWEFQELPYPSELLDVEEYDPFSCYVSSPILNSSQWGSVVVQCERDYFLYNSADGGQTWEAEIIPGGPPEFITSLIGWAIEVPETDDVDDPKSLQLYRTEDGGQTWRRLSTLDWYGQLQFVNENVGWALVESGDMIVLMHTSDGGETWERLMPRTVSYEVTPPIDITPQLFIPSELQTIKPGNVHEIQVIAEVPAEITTRLEFHPYGDTVFLTHEDGTLTQWIIDGISTPSKARIHTDWIYDLDFSLDGYWIATASKDGSLKLEGLYAYQAIPTNDLQTLITGESEVTCVAFSPDYVTLAVGIEDQTIQIWGYSEWGFDSEFIRSLEGHTGWVWDVVFSPDGRTLASASSDRTVRIWDHESGVEIHTLTGHTSAIWQVAFSPDGQILASASWDGTLKLWDVSTGRELYTLREHDGWVNAVAFSPVSELLASGSADGLVYFWDPDDGDVLGVLRDHISGIRTLTFSPDGHLLATISEDGVLRFWGITP